MEILRSPELMAQVRFSDQNHCYCHHKDFKFSFSSPEPSGQGQINLTQSSLLSFWFKFTREDKSSCNTCTVKILVTFKTVLLWIHLINVSTNRSWTKDHSLFSRGDNSNTMKIYSQLLNIFGTTGPISANLDTKYPCLRRYQKLFGTSIFTNVSWSCV